MTSIKRAASQPVFSTQRKESPEATKAESAPAASADSARFKSSFSAASVKSDGSKAISDEVNSFVSDAEADFTSEDEPTSESGALLSNLLAASGVNMFMKSAGQQVLDAVKVYIKDNPGASKDDVEREMTNQAMSIGMVTKFIEESISESAKKSRFSDS
jgi:hypothetical protein